MRISENQLKNIIRNVILAEGAVRPDQLGDDLKVIIHNHGTRVWPLSSLGRVDLKQRFSHLDPNTIINMHCYTLQIKYKIDHGKTLDPVFDHVGELEMRKWEGMCNDAWEIYWADVEDDYIDGGFGPLMYDVAMELSGEHGVMCDRNSVSNSAARVWDYYLKYRADVFTDDVDIDNCPSDMMSQGEQGQIRAGGESPWHQKVYFSTNTVAGATTPAIDALNRLGRVEYSFSKKLGK